MLRLDGISAVREIDEQTNRLPNSGESYTFYGRDVYAYTGARLAAGVISFGEVGPELPVEDLVRLPVVEPYLEGAAVCGTVDVLDVRFGSLWTNIPRELFLKTGAEYGDRLSITIENDTRTVYRNIIQFARSFADVYMMGEPWDKLLAQGLVAGIANAVTTAIVGSLLCVAYAATKTKAGSLTKE